ncbi:hypothetical protein JCM3774_005734 [Rhodotorula dairenensis]
MVPSDVRSLFPLGPAELERWTRFASKGGIGQARAKVDKASQDDGHRDLMFLEGEEIVILLDLGAGSYLGYCEGVVGMLYGLDVEMLQAKLKRPVMAARPQRTQPPPALGHSDAHAPESGERVSLVVDTGLRLDKAPTARRRSLSPSSARQWVDLKSPTSSMTASPAAETPSQDSPPSSVLDDPAKSIESAYPTSEDQPHARGSALSPSGLTGSTSQTEEVFSLSAFPVPDGGGAHFGELEMSIFGAGTLAASASTSTSSQASSKLFAFPTRPTSHILSFSGMPVPMPPLHPTSAFSFSPNSSFASTMPSSVFSAGDLELHREGGKVSGSTLRSATSSAGTGEAIGQRSGTSTPGDDPTLAFIFDSYRYSPTNERSRATRQMSASQQAQVDGLGQSRRPQSGLVRSVSTESLLRYVPKPERADTVPGYGAASMLRSRLLAGERSNRSDELPDSVASSDSRVRMLHSSLDSLDRPRAGSSLHTSERDEAATSGAGWLHGASVSTTPSTSDSRALEPGGRVADRGVGEDAGPETGDFRHAPTLDWSGGARPPRIDTEGWAGHATFMAHGSPRAHASRPPPVRSPSVVSATKPDMTGSLRSPGGRNRASPTAESPERSSKLSPFRRLGRTKSSPSFRPAAPTSVPLPRPSAPITASPRLVAFPVRAQTDPVRPTATCSTSSPRPSPVDYTTGISHRDFEEETVQIGSSEFEIVKPLANLLLDENERTSSPSLAESLPSLPTAECDPVSPFRPRVAAAITVPYTPTSLLAPSTTSLSHFSPPTPSSAEGSGKGTLDEYRAREAKWIAALSSMTPAQIRKSKKIRGLVQSGIPSSVRGKVWAYLAESERFVEPGLYQTLCRDPDVLPAVVDHDLVGLDDDPQFAIDTAGRSDLESVLLAFLRCRPQLGYYPGLARIAATLLTQMPAESAFGTLVALVCGYGYHIFFPSRQHDLDVELSVFSHLLEALESKLARRLRDWRVSPRDYLLTWWPTFFSSVLPHHTVLHLLDLFFYDQRMLYRVPIALLTSSKLEDRRSFPTRDAVLNHFLAPPSELIDPKVLVSAAFSAKVTDDKVAKARKKALQGARWGGGAV